MKIISMIILVFVVVSRVLAWGTEDTLQYGRFGKIEEYYNSPNPPNVVLFISGDGGWKLGVVDMARSLASLNALVVGIDIEHYLGQLENSDEKCSYPAGDLEMLSKFIQQKHGYPEYITPILVGYSSGATLAYAILVQAPSNTFKGAISMGFCPDLPKMKPFCRGEGLEWDISADGKNMIFRPTPLLSVPWIVFQGQIDQVCNSAETEKYVAKVKDGELISLPKVGHGFSVERNWLPQFKEAFEKIAPSQIFDTSDPESTAVSDLPLIEVPATNTSRDIMAVHITGDGGWGVTDKGISKALADTGIPVVGLNSLKYFWKKKTPDQAANDLKRILAYYLSTWKKEKVVLVGYSMGADVLPFMINRLPEDLRTKIAMLVLIGPSTTAEFEFHLSNWLGGSSNKNSLPTKPEVEKLNGMNILCVYGENDEDVLCNDLPPGLVKSIMLQGGHRVKGNYAPIVEAILCELK
jgi:type IV secretory pathway VirJ component